MPYPSPMAQTALDQFDAIFGARRGLPQALAAKNACVERPHKPSNASERWWAFIEGFLDPTLSEQRDAIVAALVARGPRAIKAYRDWFGKQHKAVHTDEIYQAATNASFSLSDDGFIDWGNWVVSRGQVFHEAVVSEPEAALRKYAGLNLRDVNGNWERFGYIPGYAEDALGSR